MFPCATAIKRCFAESNSNDSNIAISKKFSDEKFDCVAQMLPLIFLVDNIGTEMSDVQISLGLNGDTTNFQKEKPLLVSMHKTLYSHKGAVRAVAVHNSFNRIITCSDDEKAKLYIYNNDSKHTELYILSGHTDRVRSAAFEPNGQRLVTASYDKTLKIWLYSSNSGITNEMTLYGHTMAVTSVAYSNDGKYLISGSGDSTMKLWKAETGEDMGTFVGRAVSTSCLRATTFFILAVAVA